MSEKSNTKIKMSQLNQLMSSRYQDIIIKFEDLRAQLQREIDQEYQQNRFKSAQDQINFA